MLIVFLSPSLFFRSNLQRSEPVPGVPMGPHQLRVPGDGPHSTKQLQRSFKGTHYYSYVHMHCRS